MTDLTHEYLHQAAMVYKAATGNASSVEEVSATSQFRGWITVDNAEDAVDIPGFSVKWYLRGVAAQKDIEPCDQHPLLHYLEYGHKAGVSAHPIFGENGKSDKNGPRLLQLALDSSAMVTPLFNEDVWRASIGDSNWPSHPVFHYLKYWPQSRRGFSAYVNVDYLGHQLHSDFAESDPLTQYFERSVKERPDPHPLFDGAWYRSCHDLDDQTDAFEHFLVQGMALGLTPNPYAFTEYNKNATDEAADQQSNNSPSSVPGSVLRAYLTESVAA